MDSPTAHQESIRTSGSIAGQRVQSSPARLLGKANFYALLVLVSLAAVPYGTVEPWWESLFEGIVFGLGALWFIEQFLNDSWNLSANSIFLPLLALALLGLLQTVPTGSASSRAGVTFWQTVSADPHGTRQWVTKMLALILVGAMLLSYTRARSRLRILIYLVLGIAVGSALFGLLRKTTQHEPGFVLPYLTP